MAKRVFILGAGFSCGAGLPLGIGLTKSLVDYAASFSYLGGLREFLAELAQDLAHLSRREPGDVSFEELFDALKPSATLQRLFGQALRAADREDDGSADAARHLEEDISELMAEGLFREILAKQPEVPPDYVKSFAQSLRADDVVVTFNYDTLVESALDSIGAPWNLGFTRDGLRGAGVLKLHGSVDWVTCDPSRAPDALVSSLRVLADTSLPTTAALAAPSLTRLLLAPRHMLQRVWLGVPGLQHRPPGLGSTKRVDETPGLGEVWQRAIDALAESDAIVSVGYSLPPTDTAVHLMLRGIARWRREHSESIQPSPRLIVVEPSPGPEAMLRRFSRAFQTDPSLVA